jgi:T4-like virus Myoviridae tail sheath stabiliser
MAVGTPQDGYYYDHQLRNYILQFMAIFAGLQVKVGRKKTGETVVTEEDCDGNAVTTEPVFREEGLIPAPIVYGHQDRVVAAIFADNTQNKPLRLPIMAAYMRNIDLAKDLMAGIGVTRRNTYLPAGGLIPDDVKVVHQRKPVPYRIDMELTLMASNTDQHFQMLEQILLMFEPNLQIQLSDGPFDASRISSVELKSIGIEGNYPSGADPRLIQSVLTFEIICYLSAPADVRRDFVEKIFMRVGAVATATENNYAIIAELDAQGAEYEQIWGFENFPFQ